MTTRRHLARRRMMMAICAMALLLKLLVPTGFMLGISDGRITVMICSGTAPRAMTIEIPGMKSDIPDHGSDHSQAEMPCAFAGLAAPALGAADAIQLAALIVFIMAIGYAGTRAPPIPRPAHLRPPPIGPPAIL